MQNKKTSFTKVALRGMLALVILLSSIISFNVQTVTYADDWKNYYYVNSNGVYCYNRYKYPSEAAKYGVPEYCFNSPGKHHYKGAEGCYSYTVITVEDKSSYPANNTNNRYLDSYFIVWVNEISMPELQKQDVTASGKAGIKVKYASPGMYMVPTSTPMITVRMKSGNPDLYTSFSSEYTVEKDSKLSWSTVGKLVQTGISIGTGGIPAAISEGIGWADTILSSSSTSSGTTTTKTGADEYCDSAMTKIKSIGATLSSCSLYESNHKLLLNFKEIYPWDAAKYSGGTSRKAEVRFNYKFDSWGGSATYTDTYSETYYINGTCNSLSVLKSDGKVTVSGVNAGYAYTGSEFKPNPTVKLKTTKLEKGTDYTISYSNNKEVGTGKVTITGKGNFTGSITIPFSIYLSSPSGIKCTSATTTKATIGWSKVTGASGYEIYRKVNSGSFSSVGTVGSSVVAYTDSKRTSGNTYTYKVRAYRTVNGVKQYSSFSSTITK